jgi:hypothetical protein
MLNDLSFESFKTFIDAENAEEFFESFHDTIRVVRRNTLLASTSSESREQFKLINIQIVLLRKYFATAKVLLYPADILKTQKDYNEIENFVITSEQLQCINVILRFPNRDYISACINPSLSIYETFSPYFEPAHALTPSKECGSVLNPSLVLHPNRVRILTPHGTSFDLDNTRQLYSVAGPIATGSELLVVMKFTAAPIPDEHLCYDPFISLTNPSPDEEEVSVNVKPVVYFQPNKMSGLSIHLDSILDDCLITTQTTLVTDT